MGELVVKNKISTISKVKDLLKIDSLSKLSKKDITKINVLIPVLAKEIIVPLITESRIFLTCVVENAQKNLEKQIEVADESNKRQHETDMQALSAYMQMLDDENISCEERKDYLEKIAQINQRVNIREEEYKERAKQITEKRENKIKKAFSSLKTSLTINKNRNQGDE